MARIQKHTQNNTKHQEATDIKNKLFLCISDFSNFIFIYNILIDLYEKCWVTILIWSMTFIGDLIKLMKQSLHGKTAVSVLLKLFIRGNERYHTTDAP